MATAKYVTYAEFLASVEDGTHAEWVNGEVIFPGPVEWLRQEPLPPLIDALKTLGLISC